MLFFSLLGLLVVVVSFLSWHVQQLQQRVDHLQTRLATLEHAAVQARLSTLTSTERVGEAVV